MSRFIKRLSDGAIFRVRCSEIPKDDFGDFEIVWEIFDNKWKTIDTPKHCDFSFAVSELEIKKIAYQLSIDSFL